MKCSCSTCGKHIEYDPAAKGTEIACLHCGATTRLAAYSAAPPPPIPQAAGVRSPPSSATPWVIIIVIAAIAVPVVIAIVGLLAAIAIPNFVKARQASQRAACVANLKQIDGAKAAWAAVNKKLPTDEPAESDLFGAQQYIRAKPICPAGGTYSVGPVGSPPTCSIPKHEL